MSFIHLHSLSTNESTIIKANRLINKRQRTKEIIVIISLFYNQISFNKLSLNK